MVDISNQLYILLYNMTAEMKKHASPNGIRLFQPQKLRFLKEAIRFFPTDRQARSLQRAIWQRRCRTIASPTYYARKCKERPNGLMIPITTEEVEEQLDLQAMKTPLLTICHITDKLQDKPTLALLLRAERNVSFSGIRIGVIWQDIFKPPGYNLEISIGTDIYVNPSDRSRSAIRPTIYGIAHHPVLDAEDIARTNSALSILDRNNDRLKTAYALISFTDKIIAG